MNQETAYFTFQKNTFYKKSSRGINIKSLFNKIIDSSHYIDVIGKVQMEKEKCTTISNEYLRTIKRNHNGFNVYYEKELTPNNLCFLKKMRKYDVPRFSPNTTSDKFICYAVKDRLIVGYLTATMKDPYHIYISLVGVHKNYRGQKICPTLIEKFINHIEHNFKDVYIYSLFDATQKLKSGHQIGDFCYDKTFAKLGYVRDRTIELLKVFVRSTKVTNRNYRVYRNSKLNQL